MSIENECVDGFITYNDADNCYEWYDDVNRQLTIYRIQINETTIKVNIYQSPILQENYKQAKASLQWRTKVEYGREFIRMIGCELNRVATQSKKMV